MTSYTTHSDATFGTDKPVLGSTHLEARDNLIAVAEGGANAPRVADKTFFASSAGTTVISSVGSYGGFWMNFAIQSSVVATATFEFSDDGGATYYGSSEFAQVDGVSQSGTVYIDFGSGNYKRLTASSNGVAQGAETTIAGLSASVDTIRIVFTGASSGGAILRFQGGESST